MARHRYLSRVYLGGGPGDEALKPFVEQGPAFNVITFPGGLTAVDQAVASLRQRPAHGGYISVEGSTR
jgi:hypothetical protein